MSQRAWPKQNMYRIALGGVLLLSTFFLPACTALRYAERRYSYTTINTPFIESVVKHMLMPGMNTIVGDSNAMAGWRCREQPVYLIPAVPYTQERFSWEYRNANGGLHSDAYQIFQPSPENFLVLKRESHCDAAGRFQFTNVADGEFYVVTNVLSKEGRWSTAAARVSVRGEERREVVVPWTGEPGIP